MTKRSGFSAVALSLLTLLVPAAAARAADVPDVIDPVESKHAVLRGSYDNSRIRFTRDRVGHVAFIGGSITEMNGYRPMLMRWLQHKYPKTLFTFTGAGISSTCSTTGAMRLNRDVLSKGPVDLFFVEYAVNDDQDAGHARRECIRGLEGIIRQVREHNPAADIVVTYFVNPSMLETTQQGGVPLTIDAHGTVANHYNVSGSNVAAELADRIKAGTMDWKTYGGVHPKPAGNAVAAGMAASILERAWSGKFDRGQNVEPHETPDTLLDAGSYVHGGFIDPAQASVKSGWKLHTPDWKSIKGGKRSRFTSIPMLCATKPGAELTLTFHGRAIGAYVVAGPDAGVVEASVDGGAATKHDLHHRYSRGLHYPRTVMFATDLKPGEHTLTLKLIGDANARKGGPAARIMQFAVNGREPGAGTVARPKAVTPEVQTAKWAVKWWMPRHEQKLADLKKAGKVDLLWVGDSITHGWEGKGKKVWDEFYAKRNAFNIGFSGDRTEQVIWRLQHGAVDGIDPKLAILMIGTNNTGHRKDPPAETAAGIRVILDELRHRLPNTKILVLAIFPRAAKPTHEMRQINDAINKRIAKFADDMHIFYLDINGHFLEDDGSLSRQVMPDLLHPHEAGYGIWARAIEPVVRKLMNESD